VVPVFIDAIVPCVGDMIDVWAVHLGEQALTVVGVRRLAAVAGRLAGEFALGRAGW
jgi:hypothetical protein